MEASELRIGNFFILPNGEIGKITYHEIRLLTISTEKPNYKPIPLTKEWLLKFGFLKDLENGIYLNINAYAFLYWQNNRVELLDNDNNFMISHCNYVHQLQNLYFALTGEELTFKSE